jgi:subtilisin family serine protease
MSLKGLGGKPVPDVLNIGFAFATLPSARLVKNELTAGPPSWTMQLALREFVQGWTMIVAPAGNQHWRIPHYPAAFPNVIGVASLAPGGRKLSAFSNRGDWVDCSADGEHVVSTFVTGWDNAPTEEKELPGSAHAGTWIKKTFESGWASWQGTCFAAAKVTAAIANEKSGSGTTPAEAWKATQARFEGGPAPAIKGAGLAMGGLGPV